MPAAPEAAESVLAANSTRITCEVGDGSAQAGCVEFTLWVGASDDFRPARGDFRPAVSRPKVGSEVLAMLVALLSVSAVLRSRRAKL